MIDYMGLECGSKKVVWGSTAIMKKRDAGDLDNERNNGGGKMSSQLDVFCRRADRICSAIGCRV